MSEPESLARWMAIACGGAVGAVLRGSLARLAAAPAGADRPRFDPALATLAANLAACCLLGAATISDATTLPFLSGGPAGSLRAFTTVGLCGALSTFSTLCGDAVRLGRSGTRGPVLGYLLLHLVGGPLAFVLGGWLAR